MTLRQKTILVIGAATTALIAWDIYAESNSDGDTISDILHDAGKKNQFFPFAFGALCAHFFFGVQDRPVGTKEQG